MKYVMIFIAILMISIVSAGSYTDCSIYGNCKPTSTSSSIIGYDCGSGNCVQSTIGGYVCVPCSGGSDTWAGNYTFYYNKSQIDNNLSLKTNFSSFNSTQFSYSNGYINILVSWLNSLFYSVSNPNNYLNSTNLSNYNQNINTTGNITAKIFITRVISGEIYGSCTNSSGFTFIGNISNGGIC